MSNKYHTGDFLLITFDKLGTKLKSKPFGTYNLAKSYFDKNKNEGETCAILRVIHNSAEDLQKWSY